MKKVRADGLAIIGGGLFGFVLGPWGIVPALLLGCITGWYCVKSDAEGRWS